MFDDTIVVLIGVNVWLMSSLGLGLLLLAIATLFIPRQSSAALELVLTWLSIWLRRLAKRIVIKRWACLDVGRLLSVGLEVDVCVLPPQRDRDGRSETLVTASSALKTWTVGPFYVWATRIQEPTSLSEIQYVVRIGLGGC